MLRRLSVAGVSVSNHGFWVMLQVPSVGYWPLQITPADSQEDRQAATSPESLTLIQLLNGVDMAGPILPPEVLSQMAVLYAEETNNNHHEAILSRVDLSSSSSSSTSSYREMTPWQRSRIRLPKVTLDGVSIIVVVNKEGAAPPQFALECAGPETGSFSMIPSNEVLQEVCYRYHPDTSAAFTSLALALRYRAPVSLVVVVDNNDDKNDALEKEDSTSSSPKGDIILHGLIKTQDELLERFPLYTTVDNLRQSSQRVHRNINRGFEIHKLTGALRIAMERGDEVAAKSIREELDRYDSMDELPTLGEDKDSDSKNINENDMDELQ